MKLIILGAPGSGKGTQANFITKEYKIPQISTGDLLRNAIKEKTDKGLQAQSYMNSGSLVPDDIVLELLKERIEQSDCKKGFILDGYPRNLTQANQLEEIALIDLVINIEVNYNILIERITGRRTCNGCGSIFHIKYNKPLKEGICDKCSGILYQRDDDTEETVKKRIKTYENQTKPLIEYYRKKNLLETLVSDGTIEEMRVKVSNLLKKKFSL